MFFITAIFSNVLVTLLQGYLFPGVTTKMVAGVLVSLTAGLFLDFQYWFPVNFINEILVGRLHLVQWIQEFILQRTLWVVSFYVYSFIERYFYLIPINYKKIFDLFLWIWVYIVILFFLVVGHWIFIGFLPYVHPGLVIPGVLLALVVSTYFLVDFFVIFSILFWLFLNGEFDAEHFFSRVRNLANKSWFVAMLARNILHMIPGFLHVTFQKMSWLGVVAIWRIMWLPLVIQIKILGIRDIEFEANSWDFKYLWLRIPLTPIVFILGALGHVLVLQCALVTFIILFSIIYLDWHFLLYSCLALLQVVRALLFCQTWFINDWFSTKLRASMIEIMLMARSYTHQGIALITSEYKGQVYKITLRTNVSDLPGEVIRDVFNKVFFNFDVKFQGFMVIAIFFVWFLFTSVFSALLKWAFNFTVKPISKMIQMILNGCLAVALFWLIPSFWFDQLFAGVIHVYLRRQTVFDHFFKELHNVFRYLGVSIMYGVYFVSHDMLCKNESIKQANKEKLLGVWKLSTISLARRTTLKFVLALESIRLPEYIQAQYNAPTAETVRESYVLLQELGFPIEEDFIESIQAPSDDSYLRDWADFKTNLLGHTNFSLGFRDTLLKVRPWFQTLSDYRNFFPDVEGFIHASSFTGKHEEIRSTARYFTPASETEFDEEEFDDILSGLWHAVKSQYANSELASPEYLYSKWVKRYNMGFGFSTKHGLRLKQLTRAAVIQTMGGKRDFLQAWKKVFKLGGKILIPAPVFTKWETLKPSKAFTRSVRTVVGSAFPHQVISAVFNYLPNHNLKPWNTPMKVGMPINGRNFDKLWKTLDKHTHIWAGDMTAFDSSQNAAVMNMVAALRKKGFEWHKDHDRISQLVDLAYSQLLTHPMGFKNFGDLATKNKGFTTGHSATTPDNSLALVINYLFAWRRVTGLRAREFFNYNTLSNFGDDHVLGWEPVFGWSPSKAIKVMAELGTIMRDEAPGEYSLPSVHSFSDISQLDNLAFGFLAKQPVPMLASVRNELLRAGIEVDFKYATRHFKSKLVGKIKGWQRDGKSDSVSEYDALISYMYMCSHHKDVFDQLATLASKYYLLHRREWRKRGVSEKKIKKPPSYNQVLRQWYSTQTNELIPDTDEDVSSDVVIINNPDNFGVLVRWLSDFPTILSPRYANTSWVEWFQDRQAHFLSWPLSFVAMANGKGSDSSTVRYLLERTPYSFLRSPIITPTADESFSTHLTRHWIFLSVRTLWTNTTPTRSWLSPVSFLRVLDYAFGNGVFAFCGKVSDTLVDLDFHILDTLLIWLLSFLVLDFHIPPFVFDIHSPSVWVGLLFSAVVRKFVPTGAIDMQPLVEQLVWLSHSSKASFTLDAPTGVGKTTRMMDTINTVTKMSVIVIVPRHLLAISVGEYMQGLFPNSRICIGTEGYQVSHDFRIAYVTPQYFLSSPKLRTSNSVFVLDEAHIDEPSYIVLRNYFNHNKGLRHIFSTATPNPLEYHPDVLKVPSTSSFQNVRVDREVKSINMYIKEVATFVNSRSGMEKILVFAPTRKHLMALDTLIMRDCSLIWSGCAPDLTKTVFLTTKVCDAGITLPDVSFVFSPDFDLYVSTIYGDKGLVSTPLEHALSPQTIKQRQGRGGRTCDSRFFFYRVLDQKVHPINYSLNDFIDQTRPATKFSFVYFPEELKKQLPVDDQKSLSLLDKFSLATVLDISTLVTGAAYMEKKSVEEKLKEVYTAAISDPTIFSGVLHPEAEEEPLNGFRELKRNAGGPLYDVEFDALTLEPLNPDSYTSTGELKQDIVKENNKNIYKTEKKFEQPTELQPEPEQTRLYTVDVSGSNGLCGVRALAAVAGYVLGTPFSTSFVHRFFMVALDEQEKADETRISWYDPHIISNVALYYFNTRLIFHAGVNDDVGYSYVGKDNRHAEGHICLEGGRYEKGVLLGGHHYMPYVPQGTKVKEFSDPEPQWTRLARIFNYRFNNDWIIDEPHEIFSFVKSTINDVPNKWYIENIRDKGLEDEYSKEAYIASLWQAYDSRVPTDIPQVESWEIHSLSFRKRFYIFYSLFLAPHQTYGYPQWVHLPVGMRYKRYHDWLLQPTTNAEQFRQLMSH